MSKGISKRQRAILELLRRNERPPPFGIFWDGPPAMTTGQIMEAIFICPHRLRKDCKASTGYWCSPRPGHKQLMHTTWRALDSLHRRGLVEAYYGHVENLPLKGEPYLKAPRKSLAWTIAEGENDA